MIGNSAEQRNHVNRSRTTTLHFCFSVSSGEQSSPRYALSLPPSVRPLRLSACLPDCVSFFQSVITLQLFALRSPPPISLPHTVWCVVFRWSSGTDLRSASNLPLKSQIKKKKTHNKLTLDQSPGATSLLVCPVNVRTSCMLTPGTLWFTPPPTLKDGCLQYFTCVSMVHI